jgi:hypothetical protein
LDDADGDLAALVNQITPPDGATQPTSETSISQLGAVTTASVPFQLSLPALPTAGDYTVTIWARDRAGHDSAKLSAKVTAK